MKSPTANHLYLLLLAYVLFLSISGFVLEYGFGAEPCQMCWWQRWGHYAIAAFALLGFASCKLNKRLGFYGAGLAALAGFFVAVWQVLAQHKLLPLPPSCRGNQETAFAEGTDLLAALQNPVPACDEVTFTIFGGSLATWNIFAMLFVLAICVVGVRKPKTCGRFSL